MRSGGSVLASHRLRGRGAAAGGLGGWRRVVTRADSPEYLAKCKAEAEALERSAGMVSSRYELREGTEELDLLLGIVCDCDMPVEDRIRAADKLAPYRHAKKGEPVVSVSFDLAGFLEQLRRERGGGGGGGGSSGSGALDGVLVKLPAPDPPP